MFRKFHVMLAASCAALAFGASANAQNQMGQQGDIIPNATGLLPNYDSSTLEAMMTEYGLPYQVAQKEQGGAYVVAEYKGKKIILDPQECGSGACKGLRMLILYTNSKTPLEVANLYNSMFGPSRAVVADDNLFFHRYLIGDYGQTRGSFTVDFLVFSRAPDDFASMVQSAQSETVSFDQFRDAPVGPANVNPSKSLKSDVVADQLNSLQKVENFGSVETSETMVKTSFDGYKTHGTFDLTDYSSEFSNSFTE